MKTLSLIALGLLAAVSTACSDGRKELDAQLDAEHARMTRSFFTSSGEMAWASTSLASRRSRKQAGDGQDDVAVADRGEHLLAQSLGPEKLALLLARGTEGAGAAEGRRPPTTPAAYQTEER
jgi:hypothetical protein